MPQELAVADPLWHERAACRGRSVELFFSENAADVRAALRLCRSCPVRQPCYEVAMANREYFGVWGGSTERERRRVFRAERRARREQRDAAA